MLCDLRPGNLEKHRWNRTARDLDRAFAYARLSGVQTLLLQIARELSWSASAVRRKPGEPLPDALPFTFPVTRIATDHGFSRGTIYEGIADLKAMGILSHDDAEGYRINKDYRTWITPKTGQPIFGEFVLGMITTPEVSPYSARKTGRFDEQKRSENRALTDPEALGKPGARKTERSENRAQALGKPGASDVSPYRNGRASERERVLREIQDPFVFPQNPEPEKDTTEFSTPQGKSGDDHVLVPQGKAEPVTPAVAPVSQPDPQPVPGLATVRPTGDQPKPAPVETEEDREEALRLRRLSEFKATAQWLRRAYPEVDENFGGNLMGWLATYDLGSIRDAIVKSMENCKAGGRARYVNATLREWRLEESKPKPKPADAPKPKPPEPKYYVPEPGTPPIRFITKAQREELERKNRWRYGRVI